MYREAARLKTAGALRGSQPAPHLQTECSHDGLRGVGGGAPPPPFASCSAFISRLLLCFLPCLFASFPPSFVLPSSIPLSFSFVIIT